MDVDASELYALARDFGDIGAKSTGAMADVFRDGGKDLRDQWKANARQTSGTHAKYYPDAITSEMRLSTDIVIEVGPEKNLKQGFLGEVLEYGGRHSPPHLDGQKAADEVVPRIDRRIDAALGHLGL